MFNKITEKIIHSRLYAFLETHNILYEKQFGFRKNNSTIFALMQITEKNQRIYRQRKIWMWYLY